MGWDRLPVPLGLVTLIGVRERLREANLHHPVPDDPGPHEVGSVPAVRTLDGTGNDVNDPGMGAKDTVFGRNVPIDETWPEAAEQIQVPDPRDVSRSVLGRREFIPATSLNVLAAAWIQFQIRDWFRHGEPDHDDPWRFPIAPDDDWPADELVIGRTAVDDPVAGQPSTFTNHETHWWDASQVYGTTEQFDDMVRTRRDGKLALRDDGMLPVDPATLAEFPGGIDGWWVGLALLHVVFMREHNAICDRLHAEHPSWEDQQLYDHARLVNAALIAKIHTVEWTPGILGHPTLQIGMRANWWGLAGERLNDLAERIGKRDILSGIPGSETDHHGVPYSLTEEFVTVYRMHPLIPDDYVIRSVDDDTIAAQYTFPELAGANAAGALDEHGFDDLLYSLGVAHPGAITLRNYPTSLQQLELADGHLIDLAATDILRTRERGVPRYNRFRELLHLPRYDSIDDLTDDPQLHADLDRLYNGDIDQVDTVVGLFGEQPPAGFGFSDTAFRIFVLMATRRLKSDRFFTTDYRPEIYTQGGLDWIAANDMRTVLRRHAPALSPMLDRVDNAFAPWPQPNSQQ